MQYRTLRYTIMVFRIVTRGSDSRVDTIWLEKYVLINTVSQKVQLNILKYFKS